MRNLRKTIDVLFFMYHGLVGSLFGLILIILGNTIFSKYQVIQTTLGDIGSMFIVGSIFGLLYMRLSRDIYYDELRYLIEREETGFRRIFPDSNDPELKNLIQSRIETAKDIKMYGIAINILWNPKVVTSLKVAVRERGARVKILLADISSTQIQTRLTEEEDFPFPSTNGKEIIDKLYKHMKSIEDEIGDVNLFDVRVFSHYPAFGLIIIDDETFFYPYGFKAVGTVAPVTHLSGVNSPQTRYFRDQFDSILASYPKERSLA